MNENEINIFATVFAFSFNKNYTTLRIANNICSFFNSYHFKVIILSVLTSLFIINVELILIFNILGNVPVDAAAAPSSTGGISKNRRKTEAAVLVILAVAKEEAASVLWWRH